MLKNIFIIPLLLYLAGAEPAHAYVDPGSGSFMVQAILASLLGAALAVKIFWKKLADFFRNLFHKRENSEKEN